MGLKIKKPMEVKCDSKGAVDLVNGWTVGGGTKHMDIRLAFLQELKEANTIRVSWIPTGQNTSDIHTKNMEKTLFEQHAKVHVGDDEYFICDK